MAMVVFLGVVPSSMSMSHFHLSSRGPMASVVKEPLKAPPDEPPEPIATLMS